MSGSNFNGSSIAKERIFAILSVFLQFPHLLLLDGFDKETLPLPFCFFAWNTSHLISEEANYFGLFLQTDHQV